MTDDLLDADDDLNGKPSSAGGANLPRSEVRRLRDRVQELELELRRHQLAAAALEREAERAKDTLSFRLGYALIHAPKSWQGLRSLPAALWELHLESKRRRERRRTGKVVQTDHAWHPSAARALADQVMSIFLSRGFDAALAFLREQGSDARERAAALTRLATAVRATDSERAVALATEAYGLEPTPSRAKWLALNRFRLGEIRKPAELLASLPSDSYLKPEELDRLSEIRGLARVQAQLPAVPPRSPLEYEPRSGSCLYVTASSLPYTVSGYTVRSQAMIRAIRAQGFAVTGVLRPGYPADRGIQVDSARHQVDDVEYLHLPGPHVRRYGIEEFTKQATRALTELGRRLRPELIHAASNHVNALPALLAARQLGIPFVYEVRGMWELTAATRSNGWEETERFQLERSLEALVASQADAVLTLTSGLAEDLASRGVPAARISIVPNCVDPERFERKPRDEALAAHFGLGSSSFTLVYAGSLLHYEGLDDAVRAVARLASSGKDVVFLVAGDGEARESLLQLAKDLDVASRVRFLGKLPPEEVPRLWSVADAAVFPRKPFRVCELVSPLKPLEPMMMEVPVVVSSVAALREMVQDGVTGLVHRAGDPEDLASKLRILQGDAAHRRQLGAAARTAVLAERTWDIAGKRVLAAYGSILSPARASNPGLQQSAL